MTFEEKSAIVISQLRADRDRLQDAIEKMRAEIERLGGDDKKAFCKNLNESYKQGLKDALKVIDKYMAESEEE